jgi:dTDP-4-amino-4,6-dideoxygalactose transaminase
MRIGRTVPPAAAPLRWTDLWNGIVGMCSGERSLRALEQEIREHFGVTHVFLVSSGTAALALTLEALKSLSAKTDVVVPAYTCFSVPAAVLHARLRPVSCDISPSTFDFDPALLEQALNAQTLCVIAHHLFGLPSNIGRIRALCAAGRIVVVEDAAQAMGVEANGRPLGTLGDVGIFSLGRGKQITCGSGGIIVTRSREIAEAIGRQFAAVQLPRRFEDLKDLAALVLMKIFIRPRLYWIPAALPFLQLGETIFPRQISIKRLSGMKAGLLRTWRRRLAQSNQIRSATATYFHDRLQLGAASRPSHPYLRLPWSLPSPAVRERILALSRRRGLGLSVAYPTPINEIPQMTGVASGTRFPAAKSVAATLVTVPTHEWLSDRDKRAIGDLCAEVGHAC